MEKLTQIIPNFRIGEETKNIIKKMADEQRRKLTEFIRLHLETLAADYKKNSDTKAGV